MADLKEEEEGRKEGGKITNEDYKRNSIYRGSRRRDKCNRGKRKGIKQEIEEEKDTRDKEKEVNVEEERGDE